ncbi:hypothetical protein ABTZ03_24005 [Kitasatospora sp. NPDC096077]|uniref:hypothetical protein n=1 Tax=Kitasatospora sp. NPDC096077 TaxID=3155544 RepID=UPI003328A2DC
MPLRSNARWTGLLATSAVAAGMIVAVPTSAHAVTDVCGAELADWVGSFNATYSDEYGSHDNTVSFYVDGQVVRVDKRASGERKKFGFFTVFAQNGKAFSARIPVASNSDLEEEASSVGCSPVTVNGSSTAAPTVTIFKIFNDDIGPVTYRRTA